MNLLQQYISLLETYKEFKSTFSSDGKEYDLNPMFAAAEKLQKQSFKVSDLTWCINMKDLEQDRVDASDINIPILVTQYQGKWLVIDGAHRVAKCVKNNESLINGYVISPEQLVKAEIKK